MTDHDDTLDDTFDDLDSLLAESVEAATKKKAVKAAAHAKNMGKKLTIDQELLLLDKELAEQFLSWETTQYIAHYVTTKCQCCGHETEELSGFYMHQQKKLGAPAQKLTKISFTSLPSDQTFSAYKTAAEVEACIECLPHYITNQITVCDLPILEGLTGGRND